MTKKIQSHIFIVALAVIAITAGILFSRSSNVQETPQDDISEELPVDFSHYINYSDSMLAQSQQRGKAILFFAATTWCQTCSALEDEILERSAEIPPEITILKVDYDNDSAMNRKWGVTMQHTLVEIDENGEEINRWVGGGFDTLLQNASEN